MKTIAATMPQAPGTLILTFADLFTFIQTFSKICPKISLIFSKF
jgi:hypothetical protein